MGRPHPEAPMYQRPGLIDRNQAITPLTATGLLDSGPDSDDSVMIALREELR